MSSEKRFVFICSQQRPAGHPRGCCAAKGSTEVLQALWAELRRRNAYEAVSITYSGCLGPCDGGPNVMVFPGSVLYQGVGKDDAAEIFDAHLVGGVPVERLLAREAKV